MSKSKYQYYNRDLSWLRFNHRVLQEMMDVRNPLFERLKFAAIFSSNLDEFFEVRVSSIRRIKTLDKSLRKKLISKPNRLLKGIKKNISELEKEFNIGLFDQLLPQLKAIDYHIILPDEYDDKIKSFCENYFSEHIEGGLKSKSDFETDEDRLFIKSGKVYLIGLVANKLLVYELPSKHQRFVSLDQGANNRFLFLDDLIRENLRKIHGAEFYSLKASRDAELYIQDEYSGNLKDKIEEALSNRETGQISTATIDKAMPKDHLKVLYDTLDISEIDILLGGRYHKLTDIFSLDLPDTPAHNLKPLEHLRSSKLACYNCILHATREKDTLLYYPYESFEEVIRFVNEASVHPEVETIKVTLYRVSKTSAVAEGLLKALKNGKDVCVFIETKARFDESNNIYWGKKLSEAGANVIYSYPEIKVHSKIMYVKARNEEGVHEYAYIGTGNFNEKTSKIYTDYGLLTADKKITSEISRIFEVLEKKIIIPKTKKLLVSPFSTRRRLEEMISNEMDNASQGKEAYIIFKMNSLQDTGMIKLLYKASNAGVKIQLLVRGICCLIPGVEGMSENITAISNVDRFLEHGRVYIFCNSGEEKMYIGSADLMTRNLDNRIEVLTPIQDKDAYAKIRSTLDIQQDDQVKARIIDERQKNIYQGTSSDYQASSQHQIYSYLEELNKLN